VPPSPPPSKRDDREITSHPSFSSSNGLHGGVVAVGPFRCRALSRPLVAVDLGRRRQHSRIQHDAGLATYVPHPPICSRLEVSQDTTSPRSFFFFHTGNPVRESGPPACMAKLIMMRHRVRGTPPPSRWKEHYVDALFFQINQVNSKKKGGHAPTRHRSHPPSPAHKLTPPPFLPFQTKSRNLTWLRFNRRSGKHFH